MDVSRETLLGLLSRGPATEALEAYHDLLATRAVEQGLIGPRETERLWDRHIANSARVVLPAPGLVPSGASVADIGSGAGLPGIVWAIVRPDLRIDLIEPLLRRSTFLVGVIEELGLQGRVTVVRSRAEQLPPEASWDVVTARAVAPLERLAGWTLPLLAPGGSLLALKGASAEAELHRAAPVLAAMGAGETSIVECGADQAGTPTRVVVVRRSPRQRG